MTKKSLVEQTKSLLAALQEDVDIVATYVNTSKVSDLDEGYLRTLRANLKEMIETFGEL